MIYWLGFPTGRDSATFRDKGIEVSSLSRDNGTSSKSCHMTGRTRTACQSAERDAWRDNHYFSAKIRDGTRDGTITIFSYDFLFYNIFSCFRTYFSCFRTSFPVLERTFLVLECPFPVFWFFWVSYFVPERPGTEEFVPRLLLLPLSRDKEIFLSRDIGTMGRPGLSRDVSRDPGNPNTDYWGRRDNTIFIFFSKS